MAKGRRLTSSRSERLLGLGNYGFSHHNDHHSNVSDVSELSEDDVWSMVEDTSDNNNNYHHHAGEWTPRATLEDGRVLSRNGYVGGLSLAFEGTKTTTPTQHRRIVHNTMSSRRRNMATSAPVNVPDWSKIYRVDSVESFHDSDEEEERVRNSAEIEPPHEYLARSRKMNNMSVYEGVGRTLKGRDMSRVRDAVWSQTGFEG